MMKAPALYGGVLPAMSGLCFTIAWCRVYRYLGRYAWLQFG